MSEMKNSGLGYLGEIPSHWEIERVKNFLKFSPDRNPGNAMVLSLYREYGVVPKDSRDDNHNVTSEDTSNYRFVQEGDFVVNKMKAWQGSMAVSSFQGIVSPAYYVYRFKNDKFYKKYLHFLLRSKCYADEFRRLSAGIRIGQWDLSRNDFESTYVAVPPLEEQRAIADYIESQLAKVDTLIENVQLQIEQLQRYKQAIVSKYVVEGLNPQSTKKESGIYWVGEIPAHWNVVLLSSLFSEHKKKNTGMQNQNLLSLSYGKIKSKDINTCDGLLPESFEGYNIIDPGDIVLRLTDLQNDQKSLRTGLSTENGIVTSAYVTIRQRNSNLSAKYMHYYLHAFDVNKGFYALGSGVRQGLNFDGIRKLEMLLPPIEEQKEISSFLDQKCASVDALIAIKQSKIEQLEKYKKSIIYEYVTGKKEAN